MLAIFLCLLSAYAIQLGKSLVRIDEVNFISEKSVPLNVTDTSISIGFTFANSVTPEHVAISLFGVDHSKKQYFHPKVIQNKVFELTMPINAISPSLLQDEINVEIITGSTDKSLNSILPFVKLIPSAKLATTVKDEYEHNNHANAQARIIRYTTLPEIYHQFREQPKSVLQLIIVQFIFEIFMAFVVLLIGWLYTNSFQISFNSISGWGFIAVIISMEYLIVKYYLFLGIFEFLKYAAVLGALGIFLGSKTLKEMNNKRIKGTK
ncbi:dolichyl-diphosphooligosaccharide-protein glycotransferase [Martiniozyma asiatica (nom. inval.)]|nr:dolichyl-diphosphooligosaccharide-protein glycotransferase [Martiniozyma asiatica]